MTILLRLRVWAAFALAALSLDVITKAAPHAVVAHNSSHTPTILLVLVGLFLCGLGLFHSNLLAAGSGLMFGGLCGNGGQLLLEGYASDWIPVAGVLTNAADICGAAGLVCCFAGYIGVQRRGRRRREAERPRAPL